MWLTFRDVSFGPDSIPGQTLDRIVLFIYHADGPLAMDGGRVQPRLYAVTNGKGRHSINYFPVSGLV